MLEGKAKELFEEWLLSQDVYSQLHECSYDEGFYGFPLSMQWGVYQDFADSFGYDVVVDTYYQAVDYNHWFLPFFMTKD